VRSGDVGHSAQAIPRAPELVGAFSRRRARVGRLGSLCGRESLRVIRLILPPLDTARGRGTGSLALSRQSVNPLKRETASETRRSSPL